MNTAQRIVKNTFFLLFSGITAQFLIFISIIYLARILGPSDFGKINFAMAIIAYVTLFANLGLPLLGTREIAREKGKVKNYLGSILTLRLCLALFCFGLLFVLITLLNQSTETKYLILLYGIGLIPSALLLDWVFQGVEKMEYLGLGRILTNGIYVGLVLMFIKSPEHLLLIPCFKVAGGLLTTGVLIVIFFWSFGRPRFTCDVISWQNLLRQALPLGISIILIQIIYNIDTVMLGFMKSDTEVGYYNAVYKIILPLIMVGSFYFDAIFPVASNYFKTSLHSLKKLQSYTTKFITTIAFPLAVGGTILARPIMNFLYDPRYNEGILAFQILIWVVALIYLNMIYARGLWACNKQNAYLKIVAVQAVANMGLNIILIPPCGIVGAAISTVSAELLGFFFYYRAFNKIIAIPIHKHLIRPLLGSLVMALFLGLGLIQNLFLLIAGGIVIYMLSLFFMKGIMKEDIQLMYKMFLQNNK